MEDVKQNLEAREETAEYSLNDLPIEYAECIPAVIPPSGCN